MIVKTKISWRSSKGAEGTVIDAYYNNLDQWNEIKAFYLEKGTIEVLTNQIRKMGILFPEIVSSPIFTKDEKFRFHLKKGTKLIAPKKISYGDVFLTVFEFKASYFPDEISWFNWEKEKNSALYSWGYIYEAVLHGIQVGMSAAFSGKKTINGLLPEEYAWKYMEEQEED